MEADRKGFTSIAFPAIGSGGMRYPHKKLATWFKKEFFSFQGSSLKNIDIIIHHSDANSIRVSWRLCSDRCLRGLIYYFYFFFAFVIILVLIRD